MDLKNSLKIKTTENLAKNLIKIYAQAIYGNTNNFTLALMGESLNYIKNLIYKYNFSINDLANLKKFLDTTFDEININNIEAVSSYLLESLKTHLPQTEYFLNNKKNFLQEIQKSIDYRVKILNKLKKIKDLENKTLVLQYKINILEENKNKIISKQKEKNTIFGKLFNKFKLNKTRFHQTILKFKKNLKSKKLENKKTNFFRENRQIVLNGTNFINSVINYKIEDYTKLKKENILPSSDNINTKIDDKNLENIHENNHIILYENAQKIVIFYQKKQIFDNLLSHISKENEKILLNKEEKVILNNLNTPEILNFCSMALKSVENINQLKTHNNFIVKYDSNLEIKENKENKEIKNDFYDISEIENALNQAVKEKKFNSLTKKNQTIVKKVVNCVGSLINIFKKQQNISVSSILNEDGKKSVIKENNNAKYEFLKEPSKNISNLSK